MAKSTNFTSEEDIMDTIRIMKQTITEVASPMPDGSKVAWATEQMATANNFSDAVDMLCRLNRSADRDLEAFFLLPENPTKEENEKQK